MTSGVSLSNRHQAGFRLKAAPESFGGVFYQLLMLASFLLAGQQDARQRLVSDYYLIPGIIAAILAVALLPSMDFLLLARITLIGVIAFAFTWFGFIGQADAIALTLISSDPAPYAPIPVLLATGVVAIANTLSRARRPHFSQTTTNTTSRPNNAGTAQVNR